VLIGLIVATVADLGIALLLIAVSGLVIGSGPESIDGGLAVIAAWIAAIIVCLAAPVVGFVLHARGRAQLGFIAAALPAVAGLFALVLPAPY
jgi:hypothetical protein